MLSQAENERLTRIGPGTSIMGDVVRQYWMPAEIRLLSPALQPVPRPSPPGNLCDATLPDPEPPVQPAPCRARPGCAPRRQATAACWEAAMATREGRPPAGNAARLHGRFQRVRRRGDGAKMVFVSPIRRRLQPKATGILATVVNGEVLWRKNEATGALPERLIRGAGARNS